MYGNYMSCMKSCSQRYMYLHDWEKATPFLERYKVGDRSLLLIYNCTENGNSKIIQLQLQYSINTGIHNLQITFIFHIENDHKHNVPCQEKKLRCKLDLNALNDLKYIRKIVLHQLMLLSMFIHLYVFINIIHYYIFICF